VAATEQPAAPSVPSLGSLDDWLDTVNAALLAEQGYVLPKGA
jgi:hypothetical protein